MRILKSLLIGLGLVAAVVPPVAAQTGERVGVAAAVRGYVFKSAQPGRLGQRLRSGMPVFEGERITTGRSSRMQLLLTDQSVFTVGPNSSMVMDEYVYKPKEDDQGTVVARFVTGVFRFLTGKIATKRPRNMRMRANQIATIGIRGTAGSAVVQAPANAPMTTFTGDDGNPITDFLPFQPVQDLSAPGAGVVLDNSGTNAITGDPNGSVEFFAGVNGPVPPPGTPSVFLNDTDVGAFIGPDGIPITVPADQIRALTVGLDVPPSALGGIDAEGEAESGEFADGGAQAAANNADFVASADNAAETSKTNLGEDSATSSLFLTAANFGPGVLIQTSIIQTDAFQSNGVTVLNGIQTGIVSFNTSTLSGSIPNIQVTFDVNGLPKTFSGGSAILSVGSAGDPLFFVSSIDGLNNLGAPADAAQASGFLNLPNESSGDLTTHFVLGVAASDPATGLTTVGGTVVDASP